MREDLRATALMAAGHIAGDTADARGDGSAADKAIAAAQVECQLVLVAMESAVLRWDARGYDALEIRFQKFKWSYIQLYRAAHERWRRESERFVIQLGEAREHFAALRRPNSIAALAHLPETRSGCGSRSCGTVSRHARSRRRSRSMSSRAVRDAVSCWVRPCPWPRLTKFSSRYGALRARLAALSHDAIARLIRQHDSGHRLDGFLKITQAAQTDVLVRVLDDNLARYLGHLLDEVQDAAQKEAPGVVQPFTSARRGAGKRSERTIKPRPD